MRRRRRRRTALVKYNNPHLAGGEKRTLNNHLNRCLEDPLRQELSSIRFVFLHPKFCIFYLV